MSLAMSRRRRGGCRGPRSQRCRRPRAQRRFRDLMLPHLDAAYTLARYLARNDDVAQDVVQDAFVRALRGFATTAARMRKPGSLRSFATSSSERQGAARPAGPYRWKPICDPIVVSRTAPRGSSGTRTRTRPRRRWSEAARAGGTGPDRGASGALPRDAGPSGAGRALLSGDRNGDRKPDRHGHVAARPRAADAGAGVETPPRL